MQKSQTSTFIRFGLFAFVVLVIYMTLIAFVPPSYKFIVQVWTLAFINTIFIYIIAQAIRKKKF